MRAFIFSLDAFVAFTLALVAIYSLIFFSSVPSSYYYLLTQGHYLSRDVLMALSTTTCTDDYGPPCTNPSGSLLDNIVSETNADDREALIQNTVGDMVPPQFGYVMEMSDDGDSWSLLYDTKWVDADPHAKSSKKLTVSSRIITFGYSGALTKPQDSIYKYNTCGADDSPLITCGESGQNNPSDLGELVPESDFRIVKLTVFI